MKKFFQEKPWYFAFVVVGFIASTMFEEVVSYYFGEEQIKKTLSNSYRLGDLLPWFVGGGVLIVCMGVYIYQLRREKKLNMSAADIDTLNEVLSKTISENEYIESIQAFQYWPKNDSKRKYIKLCYLAGTANERIEINTILQTYFYFTYPVYKRINNVSALYSDYIKERDPIRKENAKTSFLAEGKDLCEQLLNNLNAINSVEEIGEFHCEMYRVLTRLLSALSNNAIESILTNQEVEQALIKRKKTGILGAVVLNDLYIFRNQNSLVKADRIYFTFPYSVKKRIVMLAAINGSCFPADEAGIEEYCKSVIADVCSS